MTGTREQNQGALKSATRLDSETSSFLEGFSEMFASMANLSIPEQRATMKRMFCIPEDQLEPMHAVSDKIIQGKHGPINTRIYTPSKKDQLSVIVFFHKGGWVYGSIDESEEICRRLANETGAIVVAVEYKLSPEYKFPVPLDDCYDAARWVVKNAANFSGNPDKVILCGESAGGNLAAAVALMAHQTNEFKAAGQLLLCPVLTNDLEKKHYDESLDKALISYENMRFFWNMYLSSSEDGNNPLASPLKCTDLANLPPCFVITAEYDALKHEGIQYGLALQNAGVPAQLKTYPDVIHCFYDLPMAQSTKKEALKDISTWIKQI